jgi:hypothetical protein
MRHTHTHTHTLSLSLSLSLSDDDDDDDDDDIINLNKTLLVLMSFVALVVGTTATSPNIGALRQEFVDQQGLDIVGHILAQTTEDGEIKQCCLSILRSIGEQGWLVDSRWLIRVGCRLCAKNSHLLHHPQMLTPQALRALAEFDWQSRQPSPCMSIQ